MTFDGETYREKRDGARLRAQLDRVRRVMADGAWRSLSQIAEETGDASTAAISARLRDLRKARFGRHTVERRYVSDGLFEYRVSGGSEPPVPIRARRTPQSPRPSQAEIRAAVGELRSLVRGASWPCSPELLAVGRWLAELAERKERQ